MRDPEADQPRSRIDRFTLVRRLGEGSMGVVYEAYDETLGRGVALKRLRPKHSAVAPERLLREARALARIAHPNVVPVYEVGTDGASVYLVMELLRGRSLKDWLAGGSRSWPEILAVFVSAGRGLAAAHEAEVIHRDFKPENVVVDDEGRPRVLDFGLATFAAGADPAARRLTRSGAVVGTPSYMSPEHFASDGLTHLSDQWSFCAALYAALFGTRPVEGEDLEALRVNVLAGKLRTPPPSDVPRAVVAAVLRGLSRKADQRFPSLTHLLDVLQGTLDEAATMGARAVSAHARLAITAGLLAGLAAFGAWTWKQAAYTHATHLALPALGAVGLALAGFAFRRELVANAWNRRVALLSGVGAAVVLLHRALALVAGTPLGWAVASELWLIGIFSLACAGLVQRWIYAGGGVLLAGSAVALLLPERGVSVALVAYGLLLLGAMAAWGLPLRRPRSAG